MQNFADKLKVFHLLFKKSWEISDSFKERFQLFLFQMLAEH